MRDLAVLIPTRGRPENIRKVIGAWDFTNAWDDADMILIVDADDPEIQGYRDVVAETEHPDTGEPLVRLIEMATWMPMVHKLNMVAKDLAEGWGTEDPYWALGFAGDDHHPQTIGWAKTYLAELRKLKTGMVFGDDGYQGANLSTEWAVTSDAVRAIHRMVPADVEHMYCDNSIMEMFDAANALVHLPGIRIEHMHPIAGKAPDDNQYRRVNHRDQFRKDRTAYDRWVEVERAGHVRAIAALQPSRPVRRIRRERIRMSPTRPPFPKTFKQVRGLTPVDIEITLADLAAGVPGGQEIVELGVHHGKSALVLAWGASQGDGAHVTAVDPWDTEGNVYAAEGWDLASARNWARYWVRGLGYSNRIQLVNAFSYDVATTWAGKPVGLLYVDGDHTEGGVLGDIEAWSPHLAPGAMIAVDDYVSPDFPGVKRALDELVNAGVLAPIEVYHDRLAVTHLAEGDGRVTSITSEGVSPLPVAPVSTGPGCQHAGCVLDHPHAGPAVLRSTLEAEWERVDPEGVAALRELAAGLDSEVSTEAPPLRATVHEGELDGVVDGTSVEELTNTQMKTLARRRNIILGVRKDKRDLIIQALIEGR